ncbi:MAG: hypothetical protein DLM50_04015 [Candidatus Meridianibacter frigidus]|nr:MAG: hypothetical protein DLM50_04015 [Candidatus Eremiobacteraeota bacterium]
MQIRKANEESPDLAEDAADLALVLLLLGEKDAALEVAAEIEGFQPPASARYPQDAWWIMSRVYRAPDKQEEAQQAAAQARALMDERLRRISNPTYADRYARVRYNPEILAASSPRAAGVIGR